MSTATSGRAREYRVRDDLISKGWRFINRSAGSKGSLDLYMAHRHHGAAHIQVGTGNKTLGPDARTRFVSDAQLCSALALLAVATRDGIRYWNVSLGAPSTWTE